MNRTLVACFAAILLVGCQSKSSKSKDDAHTFTPSQKQSTAQQENSGNQTNKPLNSPAVTVNNESSPQSDRGDAGALKGQPVAEPGAPVEHEPKPAQKPEPAPTPH